MRHIENRIKILERKMCCSKIEFFEDFSNFPNKGRTNTLYIDKEGGLFYIWESGGYEIQSDPPSTLLSLTDTPNSYEDREGLFLKVNGEEDGIEFGKLGLGSMAYEDADDYIRVSENGNVNIQEIIALTPTEFQNLTEYVEGTLYIIPDNKEGKLAVSDTDVIDLW